MMRKPGRHQCTFIIAGMVIATTLLALGGCAKFGREPDSIRRVSNADLQEQHPTYFQDRTCKAPKAFIVKNEADWRKLWGQGEEPPVINWEKSMVMVAYSSIGSEGPGTLELWVLKYRVLEDVMEISVKEIVTGTWPLSTGYSRAYHIVKVPRTELPVKVVWRYLWGNRDETSEMRANPWAPEAMGTPGGWGNQSGGGQQGGWGSVQQPR